MRAHVSTRCASSEHQCGKLGVSPLPARALGALSLRLAAEKRTGACRVDGAGKLDREVDAADELLVSYRSSDAWGRQTEFRLRVVATRASRLTLRIHWLPACSNPIAAGVRPQSPAFDRLVAAYI